MWLYQHVHLFGLATHNFKWVKILLQRFCGHGVINKTRAIFLIDFFSRDKDIPARVQGGEYHIQFNGGFLATGKTISSSEAPKQLAIGCSKVFLVVSIGDGSQRDDRVSKEVEWVCDHLANEGY